MKRFNYQQPSMGDYLGDILRGNARPNQLIPTHPFLLNTMQLEDVFNKNAEHIMLLTMDETKEILADLYNIGTSYAGNIRDALSGATNIVKLVSYNEADKLVFNLKGFSIKAIPCIYQGVIYVKITGYASLRRIMNGTRYGAKHIQVLKLGIGQAGINYGLMKGTSFSIYFSGAHRVLEFIFSSEHSVAEFLGNITMDVAKAIVTIFLTKIAMAGLSALAAAVGTAILPVSLGILVIVTLGFAITYGLHAIDGHYKLSEKLIESVNKGLKAHQEISEWNFNHGNLAGSSMNNWVY